MQRSDHSQFMGWLYSCGRKQRYATGDEAHAAREQEETIDNLPLFIYECDACDGWHLTKTDPWGETRSAWDRWVLAHKPPPQIVVVPFKEEWRERYMSQV